MVKIQLKSHIKLLLIIDINGEPLSENIISKDIQDIIDIPVDKPSKPSIKFKAFVIPTIQATVRTSYAHSGKKLSINSTSILSILIPHLTTTIAANICANNFTKALAPFTSS